MEWPGVPLDYQKWSTLKNNLGVKEKDFSNIECTYPAVYFYLITLSSPSSCPIKDHQTVLFVAIQGEIQGHHQLQGINNPLPIFTAGSTDTSYLSRIITIRFILLGSPQKSPKETKIKVRTLKWFSMEKSFSFGLPRESGYSVLGNPKVLHGIVRPLRSFASKCRMLSIS